MLTDDCPRETGSTIMIGIDILVGHTDAAVVLGIVLAEAVVLYAGYGVVLAVADSLIERALEGR